MGYAKAIEQRQEYDDGRSLNCAASGCPNRWSIDMGNGKLCSAHNWKEPHDWPRITEEQQRAETDRIIARQQPKPEVAPLSRANKTAILGRMRSLFLNSKIAP